MPTPTSRKSKKPDTNNADLKAESIQVVKQPDLESDADFSTLIENFQSGEFNKCVDLLKKLETTYPAHPLLIKFKSDLEMKLSLKDMEIANLKEEKRKQTKTRLRMSAFAIISTGIVLFVFSISYTFLNKIATDRRLEMEMVLLDSLNQQAELLLLAGQPHPVEEIIERMNSIDPEYEHIKELRSETDELLQFESDYKEALNLVAEDRDAEGLDILKKLNNEKPGMWDIDFQISSIEDSIQLAESLEKGNSAYQVEQWDQVINAYENALTLDPEYNDPLMKEQLLNAYLQSIIGMLENEYTTTENLENAERYYRSAVATIPQNKAFSSERGNLEEVSSNLLELQFTQNAKAILEDKNQTTAAISKAVSYLSKAATIKPANAVLQLDLKNARFYQTGFENFIGMDWESAIANLNQIVSVDPDYAGGNARVLLYEAYYALGKHFNSLSLYQDARENLEQAEILAWDDSDNLLKLFQVQVLLGDTIGKMNDFQNAVSYYKYALEVIELPQKLSQYPTINTMYKEADNLLVLGEFEKAFTAFRGVIDGIDPLYTNSEIEIKDGVCLAFFASENISTVNAVIDANNLPNTMVIAFGRKLIVPFIEK